MATLNTQRNIQRNEDEKHFRRYRFALKYLLYTSKGLAELNFINTSALIVVLLMSYMMR